MKHADESNIIRRHIRDLYCILFQDNVIGLFELADREAYILQMKWLENKTLAEIGEKLELTKERIRQIYNEAIEKLKRKLEITAVSFSKHKEVIAENVKLKEDIRLLVKKIKNIDLTDEEIVGKTYFREFIEPMYETPLEKMYLSERTIRLLQSAGIKTLGDIMDHSLNDFLRIRNFGKKSLSEIEDYLKDHYGLELKK
jgi:DNA-directed RNA polymerase alpha subunit